MFVNAETVRLLLPELMLVLSATGIVVGGAFIRNRAVWHLVALAALVAAGAVLAYQQPAGEILVHGPIVLDGLANSLRWLLLIVGTFFTVASWQNFDAADSATVDHAKTDLAAERIGSILFAVVGTMLAASANDLIQLFLGLELISIPTYMLLFVGRRNRDSAEAAAKYFFLSIMSSGVLLYGMSFVYGIAGTTTLLASEDVPSIREGMASAVDSPLHSFTPLALLLVLAGLGFKLTAVPFHFYAPDVYQGTTSLNAGLLATLPKIAASAGIVRIVLQCLTIEAGHAWQVLLVLSLLSMTIGNVCALWQTNLRRMLAYSSIAHSGYMLIGMTVAQAGIAMGPENATTYNGGVTGLMFYLAVYTFASLGAFAAITAMASGPREVNNVDDLAGTGRTQPLAAAALAIFMFSLAGIPPLAGFWGKFSLFMSAIDLATTVTAPASTWLIILAVVAALNAATAAAYYLRVVGVMYFQTGIVARPQPLKPTGALVAAVACAIITLGAGLRPSSIMSPSTKAENDVRSWSVSPSPVVRSQGDDSQLAPMPLSTAVDSCVAASVD